MIDLKDIPMFSNEDEAITFLNELVVKAYKEIAACNKAAKSNESNLEYSLENRFSTVYLCGQIRGYLDAIQVLKKLSTKVQEDIELEREHEQSRYVRECEPEDFW